MDEMMAIYNWICKPCLQICFSVNSVTFFYTELNCMNTVAQAGRLSPADSKNTPLTAAMELARQRLAEPRA